MLNIRHGVFETNSSSVHSLTMCSGQQMQDWKDGKILYCEYGKDPWVPATPELIAIDREVREDNEAGLTYDEFWKKIGDSWEYEGFERSYITPNGEKVYAFGYYGEDR